MALHDVEGKIESVDSVLERPSLGQGLVSPLLVSEENEDTGKVITKSNQIIVNDGTYDRILIGFDDGGF